MNESSLVTVAVTGMNAVPDNPGPGLAVRCAYLELEQPDLAAAAVQLAAGGAQRVTIVPMFLGTGKHARDDLPRLLETLRQAHPAIRFELQRPVGEDPRVLDLLAAIAVE